MSHETVTIPLAELVEDMDLYPRHAVDPVHVQSLVHALNAGATFPPIVADRTSKRITDGWHRARAYQRVLGRNASVDVELVPYESEAAMLVDAVARNAAHGRRLDAMDRTRCVMMLRKRGCTDMQIALAMQIPEKQVEKYVVRVAKAPKSSGQTVPGTNTIVLKRSVAHLAGSTLSRNQAEVHAKLPGTSFLLVADQLLQGLLADMVNLSDERLRSKLEALRDALLEKLGRRGSSRVRASE
jgi:hypothetical protein